MREKLNQNDIDDLIIEFSRYIIKDETCIKLLINGDLKGFFIWCIDSFFDEIRSDLDWSILQLPDWIQFLILYYRKAFKTEAKLCWIYDAKVDTNVPYYNYRPLGLTFGKPKPNIEVGISLKKENLEGLWTGTVKSPLIFCWWANLISAEISADVKIIPYAAFLDTKLSKFNVPEGVMELGAESFAWCSNLNQVTLPRSLKKISIGAFRACTNLENVIIQDGLEVIERNVFMACFKLKQIHLPKSLKKIDVDLFDSIDLDMYKDIQIFYDGTKEDWRKVDRGEYDNDVTLSIICSDEIVDYYYGYDVEHIRRYKNVRGI